MRRRRQLISLTPLIDVVFILLLFFMLASNLTQWRRIDIETAAANGSRHDDAAPLIVAIENNGAIRVEAVVLGVDAAIARVAAGLRRQPQRRVIVRPAPAVSVQTIVDVLRHLQTAGARHMTLQRGADADR
jgi:biopolymer transport protein ExbD